MRLHSDIITASDIDAAFAAAGCRTGRIDEHGSRSRARSFDAFAYGHGKVGGQWGGMAGPSASWDDWGIVLGKLYALDPLLIVGTPGRPTYRDAAHFDWATDGRFRDLDPADAHHWHRWDRIDSTDRGVAAHECRKCPAAFARLMPWRSWFGGLPETREVYAERLARRVRPVNTAELNIWRERYGVTR